MQKFVLEFRFHSLGSVLCKREKCSAKVLEFRFHSLGSVLCKRKKSSAKVCVGIRNPFPRKCFVQKEMV